MEAFEIEDEPSEDDKQLLPAFVDIEETRDEDLIDNGLGLEGVAMAAAAACKALGAILTRYDLALGPKPSNMVGPSFSCFLRWRSRLVC